MGGWRAEATPSSPVSQAETALLTYLDEWGMTTVDRYMTGAHISHATATDIVPRLYVTMGITDFSYTGSRICNRAKIRGCSEFWCSSKRSPRQEHRRLSVDVY